MIVRGFLLFGCAIVATQAAAQGPAASASAARVQPTATPALACQAAVIDSLRKNRGKDAADVQFNSGARITQTPGGDEASVRGEGRYKLAGRAQRFSYGCSVNLATGATPGAVIQETGSSAAVAEVAAFEPDLSKLSPADCESAIALNLKRRYPRVGHITLDGESRRLSPGVDQRIVLDGRGAMQPAPGMLAVPIAYRCEIDPRNGRVLAVQANPQNQAE
jgi:hypothetical protein